MLTFITMTFFMLILYTNNENEVGLDHMDVLSTRLNISGYGEEF